MTPVQVVLFDFGGTLYAYRSFVPGARESLQALAGWLGVEVKIEVLERSHREATRRAVAQYLPRSYYRHRDMFDDALRWAFRPFGVEVDEERAQRYRDLEWRLQARDFKLRDGVVPTLKELRRRGLHVGMVSNIDEDHLRHLVAVAKLEEHFDSLLSSEVAGSCKPAPEIFHQALERARCQPHQALFVGDSLPQDIKGANRAGLQSVLLWHRPDLTPPAGTVQPKHTIGTIPEVLELLD